MTFITAVSAQVQAQQDMIIRRRPQAFAKKWQGFKKGLWRCTPCFQCDQASNTYNSKTLVCFFSKYTQSQYALIIGFLLV